MSIGQRIRDLRLERGIKQRTLAKALGIQASDLYRYESGRIKKPGADIVAKLAEELGTSVAFLLYGDESRVEYETPQQDPNYVDPTVATWVERFGKHYDDWVIEQMQKPTYARDGRAPTLGELTDIAEAFAKISPNPDA